MADLDTIIRVQLAGWRLNVESLREHGMDLIALDALMQAQSAIGAALDRHKPDPGAEGYCLTCVEWNDDPDGELIADQLAYPCPTMRDIVRALGVEVV